MIDRDIYEAARALIDEHGAAAPVVAASRARRSAARDNPFHYARWRGVGRAVRMIADPAAGGALH